MTYLVLIYSKDVADPDKAPQVALAPLAWWKQYGAPLGIPGVGELIEVGTTTHGRQRFLYGAANEKQAFAHFCEVGLLEHYIALKRVPPIRSEAPSAPTTTETLLKEWRLPPRKGIEPR